MRVSSLLFVFQNVFLLTILWTVPSICQTSSQGGTVQRPIMSSGGDIELGITHGNLKTSTDLELGDDPDYNGNDQIVGLRFTDVKLPRGAQITNAYIQFTTDEISRGTARYSVTLKSEPDPAMYFLTDKISYEGTGSSRKVKHPVSRRLRDAWSGAEDMTMLNSYEDVVTWSPPEWTEVGESGVNQRLGNLQTAIQRHMESTNWNYGDQLIFWIWGSGTRTAESYDGSGTAPALHIEYIIID